MKLKSLSDREIGTILIYIYALLILISVIIALNAIYPDIKYHILDYGIAIGIFTIGVFLSMIIISIKVPLSKFKFLNNKFKIIYSVFYLIFSVGFLLCIEYFIFQNDKTQFTIDQDFVNQYIQKRITDIHAQLEKYHDLDSIYTDITSKIVTSAEYDIIKDRNNNYCIVVDSDTLCVRFHRRSMPLTTSFRNKKNGIDLQGVRSIGVYLYHEPYDVGAPTNRNMIKYIEQTQHIKGVDLKDLINRKVVLYEQRRSKFENLLNENPTISFGVFIISNLFSYSSTTAATNIIVKTIVLLQTLLITFISGYIFKTAYKVLDGE